MLISWHFAPSLQGQVTMLCVLSSAFGLEAHVLSPVKHVGYIAILSDVTVICCGYWHKCSYIKDNDNSQLHMLLSHSRL